MATTTQQRPTTRARVRYVRMSAYKAREVLDLIRGLPVNEAADVLRFTERAAAQVIARCLDSAVANAENNDELDGDTLYVSACYADEGPTLKRWRPRARGRATRIRKRMCHITIEVSPMPPEMQERVEAKRRAAGAGESPARRRRRESRRARVARSRGEQVAPEAEETTAEGGADEGAEAAEPAAQATGQEAAEETAAEAEAADEQADAEPDEGEATDAETDEQEKG